MAAPADPPPFATRRIGFLRPLAWLARGAADLARSPGPSLLHGLGVTTAGAVILLLAQSLPFLFIGAISGFLLVGPILATGLCELSRRHEAAASATIADSLAPWRRNPAGLAGFALFALLAGSLWQIVSMVLVAVLYKGQAMTPLGFVLDVLGNPAHAPLFFAYLLIGGLMAAFVFALSVIAVPMLVDRDCTWLEAMQASLAAVSENPLPLAFWAALIMMLAGIGFATALLGFIVVMPILGHAGWHAYRDLVAT